MPSRTYTWAEIRTRVRARADQHGGRVTDAMLLDWGNSALGEFWDELDDVASHLFIAEQAITTAGLTPGVIALPADFLRTIGVDYTRAGAPPVPLREIHFHQRYSYNATGAQAEAFRRAGDNLILHPSPPTGQTYLHTYVPGPPKLVADADTVPGYSGLEEFMVQRLCADCATRDEEDPSPFLARAQVVLERLKRRVQKMAHAGGLTLKPGSIWADRSWDPDEDWR